MANSQKSQPRVAFQGEHGAFSEAAAIQLLGDAITTVPRATFDSAFRAIDEGLADALLAPVENSLAGSVVRVYDLLLESNLGIVAETILPIEHHLIGCPGATLVDLKSVSSHPMALAQCEKFFLLHPALKRVPAEDTAGSVRDVLSSGDKSAAGIAGRPAAVRYGGVILSESIQDNAENFTRFVLLTPVQGQDSLQTMSVSPAPASLLRRLSLHRTLKTRELRGAGSTSAEGINLKTSLALRLAHKPGALLSALEPFARNEINLMKIESRPIHGTPWVYQFFLDVETNSLQKLEAALAAVKPATSFLRILGVYSPARSASSSV